MSDANRVLSQSDLEAMHVAGAKRGKTCGSTALGFAFHWLIEKMARSSLTNHRVQERKVYVTCFGHLRSKIVIIKELISYNHHFSAIFVLLYSPQVLALRHSIGKYTSAHFRGEVNIHHWPPTLLKVNTVASGGYLPRPENAHWCIFHIDRFSIECRKAKTKVITLANHNKSKSAVNQSKLDVEMCNRRQARENACEQVSIGFGFVSHWLRKWSEFC